MNKASLDNLQNNEPTLLTGKPDRDALSSRLEAAETALADLQSRFLFQEDTLLQLDDALVAQQTIIDRLEKRLLDFVDKVDQQLHERQGASPEHEKPPHY